MITSLPRYHGVCSHLTLSLTGVRCPFWNVSFKSRDIVSCVQGCIPSTEIRADTGGCSVNILERIPGFCFREGWARQESEGSEKDKRGQEGLWGSSVLCSLEGVSRSEQGLKTTPVGDWGPGRHLLSPGVSPSLFSQLLLLLWAQKRSS